MGSRRDGREAALQFLYNRDLDPDLDEGALETFFSIRVARRGVRDFAAQLVRGVLEHQEAIDARIRERLDNFALDRLSAIDRNILRLAVYEMFHRDDVPPVVAMDEAIEIAKRFGTEDSSRFVNGVLDKIKDEIARPLR